jgi:uncharacterized protein (TIGR03118 family)
MQRCLFQRISVLVSVALVIALLSSAAVAQYKVTRLTSNQKGVAPNQDKQLVNAWGLARGAGSPWWVSDNVTGLSSLYNAQGVLQFLGPFPAVTIPWAAGQTVGSPSGIVFNGNGGFNISKNAAGLSASPFFLWDTLDGLIVGWNPQVNLGHAVIAVDNSRTGAVYTALAITDNPGGPNLLYAADAANNRVDIYDDNWILVGSFTDPKLPATFAPYGIRDINHQLYVTFASTGTVPGGILDVFSESGGFIKRLVSENGPLNQPWGLALAPKSFGPFSGALLVSNNTPKGTIAALDPTTGKFLGRLKDQAGKVITIDQIWAIDFGGGTTTDGARNELFFTAGPDNYGNGLFGDIRFRPTTRGPE